MAWGKGGCLPSRSQKTFLWRHFIYNSLKIWHTCLTEDPNYEPYYLRMNLTVLNPDSCHYEELHPIPLSRAIAGASWKTFPNPYQTDIGILVSSFNYLCPKVVNFPSLYSFPLLYYEWLKCAFWCWEGGGCWFYQPFFTDENKRFKKNCMVKYSQFS